MAVAFPDDDDDLAFAGLVFGEAPIDAVLFAIVAAAP
jgi:hypothetical protein